MKLHTRIFLGLAGGLGLGVLSKLPGVVFLAPLLVALSPVGTVFIRLITMVVVPLVVASLIVGIGSLADTRRVGRMGGQTLAYFVSTTLIGALIGVAVASVSGVGTGVSAETQQALGNVGAPAAAAIARAAAPTLVQTLIDMVPSNPFAAAASGDLMPLIVAVVLFGAALTAVDAERRRPVLAFFEGINQVAMVLVRWLMRLAPVAVFVLVGSTVALFGVDLLRKLLAFCGVVVIALAVHVAVTLIPWLRLGTGWSPVAFARNVSDALLMAFSTASSSATLPVSMHAATTRLGVSNSAAGFVLPAGATLNKNGSAIYKAVTAVFLARLYGHAPGAGDLVTIVFASTLAAFTGTGVPGSSLVTTLIVLKAIGLGEQAAAGIALVAGVDRPLDMCRSAVNTFSNLIGTAWVAKREAR